MMNISLNKTNTQQSFSGGLTLRHKLKASHINIKSIEDKLANKGVMTDFNNNKFFAFMADNVIAICEKLNLKLPPKITLFDFPVTDKALGYTYLYNMTENNGKKMQRFACSFNNNLFKESPDYIDEFCNYRVDNHGSSHFLNIPIHEFLHSDFFRKIQNQTRTNNLSFSECISKNNNISLEPFKNEIASKIGTYATTDVFELHSVYWAKEICDSLDKNLSPQYNPLKEPKTQLSDKLREFIDAINNIDFKKADDISWKARKH